MSLKLHSGCVVSQFDVPIYERVTFLFYFHLLDSKKELRHIHNFGLEQLVYYNWRYYILH